MSQEYTEPMEALEQRFVADAELDSELVTYDANFTITETGVSGGMVDGSSRLFTMASVGQVNTIVTDEETFRELCERGLTSALEEVLPADQIESFESAGITVDSGVKDAQGDRLPLKGLDLDRSAEWTATATCPKTRCCASPTCRRPAWNTRGRSWNSSISPDLDDWYHIRGYSPPHRRFVHLLAMVQFAIVDGVPHRNMT